MAGFWSVGPAGLDPGLIPYAPPMLPILIGLAYSVLGVSDASALVVTAVCGVLTVPVVGWLGRRTFGPGVARRRRLWRHAALVHIAFSRKVLTDVPFLLAWLSAIGLGALPGAAGILSCARLRSRRRTRAKHQVQRMGRARRGRARRAGGSCCRRRTAHARVVAPSIWVGIRRGVRGRIDLSAVVRFRGVARRLRGVAAASSRLRRKSSRLAAELATTTRSGRGVVRRNGSRCAGLDVRLAGCGRRGAWPTIAVSLHALGSVRLRMGWLLGAAALATLPDLAWWVGLAWAGWLLFDEQPSRRDRGMVDRAFRDHAVLSSVRSPLVAASRSRLGSCWRGVW